jgi:hypothetical protein
MATVKQSLDVEAAQFLASAFPQYVKNNGTNFPVSGLAFDGGSLDEKAYWKLRAVNYGSGNLTLELEWYADTASSGNVVWGARIAAITPDTDSQDVETKAFAAQATVTDSHLGTTGQRLHRCSITISGLDSLAADDVFWIEIARVASNTGSDTMTGDAILTSAQLSYSDT